MGKVMTKLTLENALDRGKAQNGELPWEQVRHVEVEALVDTGAIMLALPADIVERLGVRSTERRVATLADGSAIEAGRVIGLYIKILDRDMTGDAMVLPAGATPLIGQLQLEALDLIVDPGSREVRGRFPDGPVMELLRAG